MHRRASSPIVATIALMAVTMIAAVAVSGFLFGMMGEYSHPAEVEASQSTCSISSRTCTLSVTNVGSQDAYLTGSGSLAYGGTRTGASCTTSTSSKGLLPAGGTVQVTRIVPDWVPVPTSGEMITGSVSTRSWASVIFAGTFVT